jgi:hypothetical protein
MISGAKFLDRARLSFPPKIVRPRPGMNFNVLKKVAAAAGSTARGSEISRKFPTRNDLEISQKPARMPDTVSIHCQY